ncbi:AbrB family transcriptional regulator [Alphaproteobacteria bacterium]|nr:AbrB family transcriptional regulator [Alphaproteobacteria bacterium]
MEAVFKSNLARKGIQWAALAVLSALLSLGLKFLGVPAAFLLGPMIAAICFGVGGADLVSPGRAFPFAQAIIGCLLAHALDVEVVSLILKDWAPMFVVLTMTVGAGALVGWVMAHYGRLPGAVAAWGSSPGGAAAMVIMSGEFGADVRLVALMQYLRVLLVVASASLAAGLLGSEKSAALSLVVSEDVDLKGLAGTTALIVAGAMVGQRSRIPAGSLLIPMVVGAVLKCSGLLELPIPSILPVAAFFLIGWGIGLPFTLSVFRFAFRALPQLVLATLLLIALCGASAFLLTIMTDVSPLTAYLATSPGGLESISAIAVESGADAPFILALQTLRLFVVILTGPIIARSICRSLER